MPYPSKFNLLAWGGTLPGGEEFAGSLKVAALGTGGNGAAEIIDNDTMFDDLIQDLTNFWKRPGSQIPRYAKLMYAKWNLIGTDGKYVNDTTRLRTDLNIEGGVAPDTANPPYPHQVCWVSSYETDATRGLAARGRTFWPTNVGVPSSSLLVDVAKRDLMGASVATLIKDINDQPGTDLTDSVVVIGSPGRGSKPGIFRKVRAVRIGSRLDIQRRRAASIPEAYSYANIDAV